MKSKEFEMLRSVLAEMGWSPEQDEEDTIFYIDFGATHRPVSNAVVVIADDTKRFLFYIDMGPMAAAAHRAEVSKFITLVNWWLSIGNFEMNLEDGHARFRSTLGYRNAELSAPFIRNAILSAMSAIETCGPAMVEVMEGRKSADQAFAACEDKLVD